MWGSGDEKDLGATWGGEKHDQDMLYEKNFCQLKKKSNSKLEEIFIQLSFVVKVADIEIMFLSYIGRHFI